MHFVIKGGGFSHMKLFSKKRLIGCKRRRFAFVRSASFFIAAMTASLFVFTGCSLGRSYSMNMAKNEAESTSYIMSTMVTQRWYGDNATDVCSEIEEALQDFEKRTSLYIEDSEISAINDAAGKEYVKVSDETFDILKRSKQLCEESGGAFDITVGPLVLLWNINGQDGDPRVPSQSEIDEALKKVDYEKLLLNEDDKSVMLAEEGMKIDLGGDGKGYATASMKDIVDKYDVTGYLSVGGNMLVVGKNPDGRDFTIGIRDPLKDANSYFATINIEGYTMATSSAAEIFFEENGVKYHHILDPNTGYPGDTDLLQVTVVSKDGLLADALSTTIFLKGSECLDEYMKRDDCMVLAVTKDKNVYGSDGIWDMVSPVEDSGYTFQKS